MYGVSLGGPELLIILAIILLLFGGAKLPALARSLGRAQREFREGTTEAGSSESRSDGPTSDGPASDGADSTSTNSS